jgi:hypothetical protein
MDGENGGIRPEPIRPFLSEEILGQVLREAARMAVRKRLRFKRQNLRRCSLRDFEQDIVCRIARKIRRFVPKLRKNGRMMTVAEFAYMAACFALADIFKERACRRRRGALDALDTNLTFFGSLERRGNRPEDWKRLEEFRRMQAEGNSYVWGTQPVDVAEAPRRSHHGNNAANAAG